MDRPTNAIRFRCFDQSTCPGAWPFRRFLGRECDALSFTQQLEHGLADRAAMKEVLDAALITDEAEALIDEEACNCPGRHSRALRCERKLRQCREVISRKSSTPNPLCFRHLRRQTDSTLGSAVLTGIVLAAGNSTRMGSPKALLETPDGQLFVSRIIDTWHAAGVHEVVVVTGRDHDAIAGALARNNIAPPPLIVQNPDPSRGQLSSLLVGLDAASSSDGVLMTLVDSPLATL